MGVHQHKSQGPQSIHCGVITVSDTRDETTDKSGAYIINQLKEEGHILSRYQIVKDEQFDISEAIHHCLDNQDIQAIILNGGTGLAKRDVSYEVVQSMLDKDMPGFGEIFRMLSYTEDIGSAAILSRAIAGVINNRVIFSMPGSTGAVKLGMTKLVLPELSHIVFELQKDINKK